MSKKQIIILIVVFFSVIFISTISMYFLFNSNRNNRTKIDNVLKVGTYTLNYGQYKGYEEEYNYDTETVEKKEITLNLSKTEINNQTYEVKGTALYVNGYEMYQVVANNKIRLLAGSGVDFEYEK